MAEFGLGSAGITLASRYLNPFLANYAVTNLVVGGMYYIAYLPPNTAPDQPILIEEAQTAIGHFPYGQLVHPDVPL